MSQQSPVTPPLSENIPSNLPNTKATNETAPGSLSELNLDTETLTLAVDKWKLTDLRALINPSYRDRLWRIIEQLHKTAREAETVRMTLKNLVTHKATGTWPPSLLPMATKPDLQFSDKVVFHIDIDKVLTEAAQEQASRVLNVMIMAKREELEYFRTGELVPVNYKRKIEEALAVDLRAMVAFQRFRNERGEWVTEAPEWMVEGHKRMLVLGPVIASRAIELGRAEASSVELKEKSKAKRQQDADFTIADPESPAIRKTIEQLVNERVKAALDEREQNKPRNRGKGKGKKSAGGSHGPTRIEKPGKKQRQKMKALKPTGKGAGKEQK